jgi:tetratricopeptide (TPR) repeat protein
VHGRRGEGSVLLRHALDVALEHDKPSAALRAFYNLADAVLNYGDRYEEAVETVRRGLGHARKVGNRYWEWAFLGLGYPFYALGAWNEALVMRDGLPKEDWMRARIAYASMLPAAVPICVHRGRLAEANALVAGVPELEQSTDVQERCQHGVAKANILLAEGDLAGALDSAESVLAGRDAMGVSHDTVKEGFALALQAAVGLGDPQKADELLAIVEGLPQGARSQFLNAQVARFRAQLAARAGDAEGAERQFKGATGLFRELAVPFHLAVAQVEQAEWLVAEGRSGDAQPVLAEAREVFERLEAEPWLVRVAQASAGEPARAAPASRAAAARAIP